MDSTPRLIALTPNPAVDRTLQFEALHVGRVHRTGRLSVLPGGKGYNVARIARILGADVRPGGVLAGHAGRWIEAASAAEGLADGVFAWSPAGESRTCVIAVEDGTGRATVLNEVGPDVPAETAAALQRELERSLAAKPADWVAVCGSLPPGPGPDEWVGLIGAARRAGAMCAVDASGAWLATAAGAGPDLLRINAEEAAGLLGIPASGLRGERDCLTAATRVAALGPGAVVVSRGGAGAVLHVRAGASVRRRSGAPAGEAATAPINAIVRVPEVPVVSPIGGGDTMMAGMLVALAGGVDPVEALRRGAALATAKCLQAGSSRVDLADYRRLLGRTVAAEG